MAALTQQRTVKEDEIFDISLPLASGQKVYRGGMACVDTSSNTIKKGASGNGNLLRLGTFLNSYDNSAGTASANVMVRLEKPIRIQWWDNSTGSGLISMASQFFATVYIADDHTVTATSGGNSPAGRVWDVDTAKGVAVQATGY